MAQRDYGVRRVVDVLDGTLWSYLEAAYHVRHPSLVEERRQLLRHPGTVCQTPYVEATPVYQSGGTYQALAIPRPAHELLSWLATQEVGVYSPPYLHQAEALEAFLGVGEDLVVATGTGSGKTESFLMPILGALAIEAAERPKSAAMPGCRALLLYPLNALVADQLARIRKLFGTPAVSDWLAVGRGRRVRFGMYTSRTPYPGPRKNARDTLHIEPPFEQYYLRQDPETGAWSEDLEKKGKLSAKGKWPCKDLLGFYAPDRIEMKEYKSGKRKGQKYQQRNWDQRLKTQERDVELFMRQEMHESCPDLLITNYSMLEYMLLRPIERPLFRQTQEWLAADDRNQLILVLDEAHMYRGAAGAEVALLIRRLQARLGIPRERCRCILTSASLGRDAASFDAAIQFARDLTGLSPRSKHAVRLVLGTPEARPGEQAATPSEAEALAGFNLQAFQQFAVEPEAALQAVSDLAGRLSWPLPTTAAALPGYLYERLHGWGPAELLIQTISGKATEFATVTSILCPGSGASIASRAAEVLLTLATFAKRASDGRVLVPSRLHLFFRGLPGLHACTNRKCDRRLDKSRSDGGYLSGALHAGPRTQCGCGGRVYEVLTHRECGAAFLRAYARRPPGKSLIEADFLWHEPSTDVGREVTEPLAEVHLLVETPVHRDAEAEVARRWLDCRTGRLLFPEPPATRDEPLRFLPVCLPASPPKVEAGRQMLSFDRCPICTRGWRGRSKIMDLATKGEAPFANLVKAQVVAQPPRVKESSEFPNGGRKVLLFSDGRQKAARLARDIPREVELDSFRQAIVLAARKLQDLGKEPRLSKQLYVAFVATAYEHSLHFFDGKSQATLNDHKQEFVNRFDADLYQALDEPWDPGESPVRYREALLRQLGSSFYSLEAVGVAHVVPYSRDLKKVEGKAAGLPAKVKEQLASLAAAWIAGLLDELAFDSGNSDTVREVVAGYPRAAWGSDGKFAKPLRKLLAEQGSLSDRTADTLAGWLREQFCKQIDDRYFLNPDTLCLKVAPEQPWWQCSKCTSVGPLAPFGRCPVCADGPMNAVDLNTDPYLKAHLGFYRDPVLAALGGAKPIHVTAEEHTAQLSQRDVGVVQATTEKYELRFQDIVIGDDPGPIDVLSCTTTMEVGVDIGQLVAVGLRNVPPQRENYQQRAGRAGRRGSAVSTVVTYGQGGPHDSHYFNNPALIVSGDPRRPMVKTDNPKVARRHIHAFLIQTFFHEMLDVAEQGAAGASSQRKQGRGKKKASSSVSGSLQSALGTAKDFFANAEGNPFSLANFEQWVMDRIVSADGPLTATIVSWVPEQVAQKMGDRQDGGDPTPVSGSEGRADGDRGVADWVRHVAEEFVTQLKTLAPKAPAEGPSDAGAAEDNWDRQEGDESPQTTADPEEDDKEEDIGLLLDFLFDQGLLPTYAFPTDLCSFLVEKREQRNGRWVVAIAERPQQSVSLSLSEYAPGRLIVINKRTYRSGGVAVAASPATLDRAAPLFQDVGWYIYCAGCGFVQDPNSGPGEGAVCPLCSSGTLLRQEMITPQVFHPKGASAIPENDREQEYTYATTAQFPVPEGEEDEDAWKPVGAHGMRTDAQDRMLVVVNKGRAGEDQGFDVCNKCGAAEVAGVSGLTPHWRPYRVQSPQRPPECDGEIRRVFLGHRFQTDLMVWRIELEPPLVLIMAGSVARNALNDALRTLAEGLQLAASRHFDLDANEFSAGYRIVPGRVRGKLRADVYLFDTLAGGAGYADQVGRELEAILRQQLRPLLNDCTAGCDRSCYECLRHYGNQYWHASLDRQLAMSLLDYALDGTVPSTPLEAQRRRLQALRDMLALSREFDCEFGASERGIEIPLLVRRNSLRLAVGCHHGLLDEQAIGFTHQLHALDDPASGIVPCVLNEYLLSRNLPAAYQRLVEWAERRSQP